jgi:FtsP/CotA-like multicopper oxidase with cupredoxin domain
MKRGEVQRWRLIDTAFRESIYFAVQDHDLHEIALDGNYLGHVDTWKAGVAIDLEPGYRSDVLVKASMKPGDYEIRDMATPASQSLRGDDEGSHVIGILRVTDEVNEMDLPTDAQMRPLAPFGDTDLSKTAVGLQQVTFNLTQDLPGKKNYFQVNARAFSPTHVRKLNLGATDMWALTTLGDPDPSALANPDNAIPPVPHLFHIHVNPFQWTRQGPDTQLERVWKDTLLVQGPATTNVYTHYTDYIGKFVMHCHILDHEDLGMMEVEEVVDPNSGTAAHSH